MLLIDDKMGMEPMRNLLQQKIAKWVENFSPLFFYGSLVAFL